MKQSKAVQEQEIAAFLAKITHDWNNTLMAIAPWADVLKRRYPEDATLQKVAAALTDAVTSGRRVTEELREFRKTLLPP